MRLIESKAELLSQQNGIDGIYKQIELCGRTCYKSIDKITEDSAKPFVDKMIASKHTAMLEHGTVYLKIPFISSVYGKSWWGNTSDHDKVPSYTQRFNIINKAAVKVSKYYHNKYSKCYIESTYKKCSPIITKRTYVDENKSLSYDESDDYKYNDDGIYFEHIAYITTNLRVIQENGWLDDLKYVCEPTQYHEKRYTMKFITDRGVSHELVRHRVFSFAQESTRYCNYNKSKFGNEITFIIPSWMNVKESIIHEEDIGNIPMEDNAKHLAEKYAFYKVLIETEHYYKYLTTVMNWTPQQARQVLPNALKTEICMTGFASDWRFFFDLRYYGKTGKPHPDMELLASKARLEFTKANLWNNIMSYTTKFNKHDTEGKD